MFSTLASKTRLVKPLVNFRFGAVLRHRSTEVTSDDPLSQRELRTQALPKWIDKLEGAKDNDEVLAILGKGFLKPVAADEEVQVVVKEVPEHFDDFPRTTQPPMSMEDRMMYWENANKIFFGKDRDVKNFPHYEMPEHIKETYNFYVIPSRWFTNNIYPRLGVSGCYSLVLLSGLFICSKEWICMYYVTKRTMLLAVLGTMILNAGPRIREYVDKQNALRRKEDYEEPLARSRKVYEEEIAYINGEFESGEALPVLYEAKRELVDLLLEAEYRRRIQVTYTEFKNRLDYLAAREATETKFEQEIMVNWIVDSVRASITPQSEKQNFASCLQNLKALSKNVAL